MRVSVILKTLNEEARIAAAIESVIAGLEAVGLEGSEGEIIVADSGSRDRTVEIASGYPVTVAQIEAPARPSCGIGPQLGFQYSSGAFVCLMDGDMILDRDFLGAALRYLEEHPRAAGVTGHVNEVNLDNLEYSRRVQRDAPENRTGPLDRMNGGGLYRREAILDVGYFSDRNLHGYEEFDLGQRLRQRGWTLYRMDAPFVDHFGHSVNSYVLLTRRWKSKYLRGVGELLRAGLEQARLRALLRELPEVKLWIAVYAWWAAILVLLVLGFLDRRAWAGALILALLPVVPMSLKQRSLKLGFYAVVAWCFHAAATPLGFLAKRRRPDGWIESRLLRKA